MNERIQELAEHCDFYVGNEHSGKPREEQQRLFMEKFAELIVRDIINIVEGYCETSPEIYGLPLDILEHFDMELDDGQ